MPAEINGLRLRPTGDADSRRRPADSWRRPARRCPSLPAPAEPAPDERVEEVRLVAGGARPRSALPPAAEITAGPPPPILRFADARPRVFCAGWLRPRVYVSTGALLELPNEQLRALLSHQRHHAHRRDALRLLLAQAIADGLPFLPALPPLVAGYPRRVEAAAMRAGAAATASSAPADVAACPLAPEAKNAWRRAGMRSAALVIWALAALTALGGLVLHASGLMDLSTVDTRARGGQLCLIAIIALLVLGTATALDTRRRSAPR